MQCPKFWRGGLAAGVARRNHSDAVSYRGGNPLSSTRNARKFSLSAEERIEKFSLDRRKTLRKSTFRGYMYSTVQISEVDEILLQVAGCISASFYVLKKETPSQFMTG